MTGAVFFPSSSSLRVLFLKKSKEENASSNVYTIEGQRL
jgi:hypothetical protein